LNAPIFTTKTIKMMNNFRWTLSLLVGVFACQLAGAQYIEADSVYAGRRNSLMFLANPVVAFALQSNGESLQYGISFKRVLSNTRRLKLALGHEYVDLSPKQSASTGRYFQQSSDSTIAAIALNETFNRTTIRGGLEWSEYLAKNAMYYGVDLQLGARKQHYDAYTYHYSKLELDSSQINPTVFSSAPDSIVGVYDYSNRYIDIGLAIHIGYRIQLKEKWEVNLSFSPEFNVYFAGKNTWNLETPAPLQYLPSSGFEMQLRLLLVDIGYRF
jgi:hypothetical protein